MNLTKYIRDIPDFPKKGIVYKDITPLLANGKAYSKLMSKLYSRYKSKKIDIIIGIEARGFILASSLATKLSCGFIPIRKKGKLPYNTYKKEYDLEYGKDTIEIHMDSIVKNQRVLIVDDVIATGGTISAALSLVKKFDCELYECCFLLEISFLKGVDRIKDRAKSFSLLQV